MSYYDDEEDANRRLQAVQLAKGRAWLVDPANGWDGMTDREKTAATAEAETWLDYAEAGGLRVVAMGVDGGHSPERTAHTASTVAASMRVLSYAAEKHNGLRYPGDVYGLLGELSSAAHLQAEMLERVQGFLTRELDAGRLRHDTAASPAASISIADDELDDAAQFAAKLGESLGKARNALTHIAAVTAEASA